MSKINWKQKLSSRKFWAGVAGAVTMFLGIFGISEDLIANIAAIIVGAGGVIVSVLGETAVDVARAQNTQTVEVVVPEDEPKEEAEANE